MLQVAGRLRPHATVLLTSAQAVASFSLPERSIRLRARDARALTSISSHQCCRCYATEASRASTSAASNATMEHLAGAGQASNAQRRKLSSRKTRRRLARLSARVSSSIATDKAKDDKAPSIAQKVWHPSRPKDLGKVRQRAEKRWQKQRAKAAEAGAVDAYRQSVRFEAKPRVLRNVERAEAAGQAQLRSDRFQRQDEEAAKENDGGAEAAKGTEATTVASSRSRGVEVRSSFPAASFPAADKAWAKVFDKSRPTRFDARASKSEQASLTELLTGKEASEARVVSPSKAQELGKQYNVGQYYPYEQVPQQGDATYDAWHSEHKWYTCVGGVMSAEDVPVVKVNPLRPMNVARLAHGIDRALFNPTVFWLREPRTGIYNFDPRIRNLYDVDMFDYKALPPYLTSSIDPELSQLAKDKRKKYRGSTSSLTSLLSQIYFCISAHKAPELSGFSEGFETLPKGFSFGAKLPASIKLRRYEEDDPDHPEGPKLVNYAIDNDKLASGEAENSNYVLTQLGKSVEKLLTSEVEEYEKYLRINSHTLTEEEKTKPESYYYSESPKFLLRSQLDCSDDRLPRKTFDLKTRSVVAVRQDRANWVESSGYLIRNMRGVHESFERELWDMARSAFLKYYFQARIGNMDGILVAFHSTAHVFGFQYIPREEMQKQLFSSVEMGEQAFVLCIGMLERILDAITDVFPNDTLRITMDTTTSKNPKILIFAQAEDGTPDDVSPDKRMLQFEVEVDRYLSDAFVQGPVDFEAPEGYKIHAVREDEIARRKRAELPPVKWSLEYAIRPCTHLSPGETRQNLAAIRERQLNVSGLTMPNVAEINKREVALEKALSQNQDALARYLQDVASGEQPGMPRAPGQIAPGATGVKNAGEASTMDATTRSENAADAAVHIVSINDGDVDAAEADLSEKMSGSDVVAESQASEEEVANNEARWQAANSRQLHLRELARLGREDYERLAKTDTLEMYERRKVE